ncbi:MAG TPA: hypothetical protein PK760_09930 [Flavobacteriales bacterium]|nr:hypothetical protein [Flavobacteriales bacterium]
MKSLRPSFIASSLVLTIAVAYAFSTGTSEPSLAKREFGFSLNANLQGDHYTLFLYTVHEGKVVDSRPLRQGSFVLQAAGVEESPANIESIDLFDQHGIRNCGAWNEAGDLRTPIDCSTIGELWKLRFRGAVVEGAGTGWAGEELFPSPRQQILLQTYRAPSDPFWQGPYYGENAFRLLRDMQDPEWVRMYRDGG